MLSKNLEATIHNALAIAGGYHHEYATFEHLLLALLKNEDVRLFLASRKVNVSSLKGKLKRYILNDLADLVSDSFAEVKPTSGFQRIIQRAAIHCEANGVEEVSGIHVLAEFFFEHHSYAVNCLKEAMVTRHEVLQYAHKVGSANSEKVSFVKGTQFSNGHDSEEMPYFPEKVRDKNSGEKASAHTPQTALEAYCVNLNSKAKEGNIDCLIGRQYEIQRAIEILCRRRKNNALLVGEPGVGKTAIAEGLALRIVNEDVPDILKKSTIYSLDLGSMVAGTKYRGDFEERIKKILTELKNRNDAILFIDEIHTIIGAGSTTSGSLDASNLLKPAFAKGEIRCIGSTTFKEYHNHFEKDMALVRRFQKILVAEPDEQATIKILEGLKEYYEEHHQVKYDPAALAAAVTLSERYITDRNLPDKAIDLIDEGGARKKINQFKVKTPLVTQKDIEELVSSIANIPNITTDADGVKQLQKLEENLKSCIFGQDEAIAQLCASIKLSRAGLKNHARPTGCYLFAGATGVGKTDLAKQLAKFCNMDLIKFDMSEYSEQHSISRLIGSPPGYVGFDQGGLLTEEVDKHNYSVVLFDEIEKAHPEIYNLLLQIMDEGKLTDTTGKVVNFTHTIIILTTNRGTEELMKSPIGFGGYDNRQARAEANIEAIGQIFSPEFRNRLDKIIVFNPISKSIIEKIIGRSFKELSERLNEKRVTIHIEDTVKDYLIEHWAQKESGARILERLIESEVKHKIADEILFGKLKKGGRVEVSMKGENKLYFKFSAALKSRDDCGLEFSEETS